MYPTMGDRAPASLPEASPPPSESPAAPTVAPMTVDDMHERLYAKPAPSCATRPRTGYTTPPPPTRRRPGTKRSKAATCSRR